MKIKVTFDFSDDERRMLVQYFRKRGTKGLPRLARRQEIMDFIADAIADEWLAVTDALSWPDPDEEDGR